MAWYGMVWYGMVWHALNDIISGHQRLHYYSLITLSYHHVFKHIHALNIAKHCSRGSADGSNSIIPDSVNFIALDRKVCNLYIRVRDVSAFLTDGLHRHACRT